VTLEYVLLKTNPEKPDELPVVVAQSKREDIILGERDSYRKAIPSHIFAVGIIVPDTRRQGA
jgi:hypothetical protein